MESCRWQIKASTEPRRVRRENARVDCKRRSYSRINVDWMVERAERFDEPDATCHPGCVQNGRRWMSRSGNVESANIWFSRTAIFEQWSNRIDKHFSRKNE